MPRRPIGIGREGRSWSNDRCSGDDRSATLPVMAFDLSLESRRSTAALGQRFDGWTADGVIAIGVAVALAAVVAQAIAQVIDFTVYDLRIGALNSDVHSSIFGVMSLVADGVMAAAAGVRAMHSERRTPWLV